jgi:hypothetical protein
VYADGTQNTTKEQLILDQKQVLSQIVILEELRKTTFDAGFIK